MIVDIAIGVYAVVGLVSARLIAGHWAWKWKSRFVDRPEAMDWMGGAFFGLMGGAVWPAVLLVRGARRLRLPTVGAEREGREHERAEELERQRRAAEAHLAELERGIDDDPAAEDTSA